MRFLHFGSFFFFLTVSISKVKKNVSVFSLIRLRSKVTEHFENCKKNMRSERTEMAVKERVLRIIEFPDTSLLITYLSSIWPNFTEIGQIVVEL